jgi:hypothetical protein
MGWTLASRWKWLIATAILVLIALPGALILNRYLAANNYLFYATGTNDKAFLNATWKMSQHEVERANHTSLVPNEDIWVQVDAPSVLDLKRYKELLQKDVMLWGHSSTITYSFFDNELYEYYISMTIYDADKAEAEVRTTLEQQFGKGETDPNKSVGLLVSLIWDTPKQKLAMWAGKNNGENAGCYLGIKATYKASEKAIEDGIKAEKKAYF